MGTGGQERRGSWLLTPATAILVTVLTTCLAGCDSTGATRAERGQPTHPPATTASAGATPIACTALKQFEASNSGVSDPDLRALAVTLRATPPSTEDDPTPGAAVSMESEVRGGTRVSYQVAWDGEAWRLNSVAVCPSKRFVKSCAHAIEYRNHRYRLEPPQPAGVVYGVALPLGSGRALGCARDPVGPIGVYGASETPTKEAITVTWNDIVHMYPAAD